MLNGFRRGEKVTSRQIANFSFFFFFNSRARFVVILESVCMYGRCPFASARDAQDGGLRVPVMQHAQ